MAPEDGVSPIWHFYKDTTVYVKQEAFQVDK
jgi:hypothetical protein